MVMLFKLSIVALLHLYSTAYILTDVKPNASMHDLGVINVEVLEAASGQLVSTCYSSQISDYIVWIDPQREPMYLITMNNSQYITMVAQNQLTSMLC